MKHHEIIELLPWYVNATLSQPERQEVQEHLASGCSECAREVKSLAAMRQAVTALGNEAPEPSRFLLNRALAQIEDYERTRSSVETQQANGFRVRMKALHEAWWPKTPVLARVSLAAQLALVVVLGTLAVYQYNHPRMVYRTASGQSGASANGAKISVMFNEGVSEREIRQALGEINGQIVAGPSAQALYTIETKVAPDKPEELDRLLQKLRQNRSVIRFAERTE
jgi:anti-sigma factor RsiW